MSAPSKPEPAMFACTEADMMPWVQPRDAKAGRAATDAELPVLLAFLRGMQWLEAAGWQNVMYAPRDPSKQIYMIEPNSTGVHEGYRDEQGLFWCYDGDVWPADPILWQPKVQP